MGSTLSQIAIQQIHARGGRMTAQRQLILDTLEKLEGHPTAEDIYLAVKGIDPSVHISTVYRTLNWLEEHGLVNPRWFQENRRQQRFDHAGSLDHHHFRCVICNQIIEFEEPLVDRIKSTFEMESGAQVNSAGLILYGVCSLCRSPHVMRKNELLPNP
jgi:Fe2+ or Zn2+ uptake regulation protein